MEPTLTICHLRGPLSSSAWPENLRTEFVPTVSQMEKLRRRDTKTPLSVRKGKEKTAELPWDPMAEQLFSRWVS